MRVRIKYSTSEIAKHFNSKEREEEIEVKDNAKYGDLLKFLVEKSDIKDEEKVLDNFFFLVDGKSITFLKDNVVDPEKEVIVAYADFGG